MFQSQGFQGQQQVQQPQSQSFSGVAVQIYLCVAGSGSQRAELIKSFYTRSVQGQPTNFEYPRVQPETMASLSELIGEHLTMQDVYFRLLQTMQQWCILFNSDATSN